MTYDTYRYIFMIGLALCIFMLLVSVLLFFLLKIPSVIGYLSGATARKAIRNIRWQTAQPEPLGRAGLPAKSEQEREKGYSDSMPVLISGQSSEETTLLMAPDNDVADTDRFEIEFDITLVHTRERISGS